MDRGMPVLEIKDGDAEEEVFVCLLFFVSGYIFHLKTVNYTDTRV